MVRPETALITIVTLLDHENLPSLVVNVESTSAACSSASLATR
jgi:hypothetical protein